MFIFWLFCVKREGGSVWKSSSVVAEKLAILQKKGLALKIVKIRTVQGKSVRCCDFWPVSIFKRLKCIFWRLLHRPFKFSLGPTFFYGAPQQQGGSFEKAACTEVKNWKSKYVLHEKLVYPATWPRMRLIRMRRKAYAHKEGQAKNAGYSIGGDKG